MGNSSRRKAFDASYGLPSIKVKTSKLTGKALIILCSRSQELVISAHITKETLELGVTQCNRCLSSFSKEEWQNFDDTFHRFMLGISSEYNYPDEDELIGIYQHGQIDTSESRRLEMMADINIEQIQNTGEKMFSGSVTSFR